MNKNTAYYKELVEQVTGSTFTFLDEYVSYDDKYSFLHHECNQVTITTMNNFIRKHKTNPTTCRYCSLESRRIHKSDVEQLIRSKCIPIEIITDKNISGNRFMFEVKCLLCNSVYSTNHERLNRGDRCKKCYINSLIDSAKDVEYKININKEDHYSLVMYDNKSNRITLIHDKCGYEFKTYKSSFIRGLGCPVCYKSMSIGETLIARYLTDHNISFLREVQVVNRTRFDFSLPDFDLFIEYDGKQHFQRSSKYFSDNLIIHDDMKDKYIIENNLSLLRIPFTEKDNIDKILNYVLNKDDTSKEVLNATKYIENGRIITVSKQYLERIK